MKQHVLKTGDSQSISLKSFLKQTPDSKISVSRENVLITVVMTSKMIKEEMSCSSGSFWPKNTVVRGKNIFRTMQVDGDDNDSYMDWLNSYGCLWEKI